MVATVAACRFDEIPVRGGQVTLDLLRGVQVSASPDANCQQQDDPLKVMMNRERAAAAREAKLELIREQVSSGALVIRDMTKTERAKWAKQHATREAKLTPAERTGRAA